jgi:cyclopropane fatty-acyl-phospholipid synthase-like methyltransferase/methyltransferase-like protein
MSVSTSDDHASYDALSYPTVARAQTHPDRLAVQASLFGMSPAEVERCRVLELGCGDGGNLVPMAVHLGASEFVGIDSAELPIARARQMAGDLGLSNVRFLACPIAAIPDDLGTFDYIIAHGVYSWVPPQVQEDLLAACRKHLTAQGVAYVSYNTYPGNYMRQMVREMMLYRIAGTKAPDEQMAKAIELARFVADAQAEPNVYAQVLKAELERFVNEDANYLLHDSLEKHNISVYFHQFVEQAGRHGLQYLAEADFHDMLDWMFKPESSRTLSELGKDRISREQYLDFLKCRFFRQTLLCRSEVTIDGAFRPELVGRFFVTGRAQPSSEQVDLAGRTLERFVDSRGVALPVDQPLGKAALLLLAEHWPEALAFDELLERALATVPQALVTEDREQAALGLAQLLMRGHASGVLEFHAHRPASIPLPGERLVSTPLTRWELQSGRRQVTTTYHGTMGMDYEATAQLLLAADGTRDRAALRELMAAELVREAAAETAGDPDALSIEQVRELVAESFDAVVGKLAAMGLFGG